MQGQFVLSSHRLPYERYMNMIQSKNLSFKPDNLVLTKFIRLFCPYYYLGLNIKIQISLLFLLPVDRIQDFLHASLKQKEKSFQEK